MAGTTRSGAEVASTSGVASARTVRDIAKELRALVQSPPEGIRLLLSGDDADCISTVHVELDGPAGTPYDGGVFRMKLEFGADFPAQPPKGYFLTRIFHPNISKAGEICVNTLKRDWKPTLGLRHVLLVIRCLLIEPYPESALNEEAGKMLLDDYAEYAHHARLMTSIHAMPRQAAQQRQASAGSAAATASSATQASSGPAGSSPAAGVEEEVSPGGAQGATPLALNSSIANDGNASARAGGDSGRGVAGDGVGADLAAGGIKGGSNTGPKDKLKKVDSRKKSLKRL